MSQLGAASVDAELVSRCRAGDARAWEALVQRYQRLVYAIVRRAGLDQHTAGDVFQTVFERLHKHLGQLAEPERLQAWIVTTAKREALRQRAVAQRTVSLVRDGDAGEGTEEWDLADESPTAEAALQDLQQAHLVRLALERLDTRCRDLLTMLFADEDERLPYEEISRRLGIPVGSIGPTRARCLGKLRRLLEPS